MRKAAESATVDFNMRLKQAAADSVAELEAQDFAHREALSAAYNEAAEERASLEGTVHALEERWRSRGSRPEDLDRINELEALVEEKDAIVQQTKAEMAFFKRELLNREENFNKRFGAAPNVGVMQVLKAKDKFKAGKGSNGSIKRPPMGGAAQQQAGPGPGPVFPGLGLSGGRM